MILFKNGLKEKYGRFADPRCKIAREVECGSLTRVAHGIYETDAHADGMYLATCIRRPSYLSFEFALARYDLIPEAVYSYSSATFRKGKSLCYENAFGTYWFQDVPDAVYPKGITILENGGYSCQIASPEKALCDKLYTMPPVRTVKDMEYMLFESLRVEEDDFRALKAGDILEYAPLYRRNNLYCLEKLVRRMEK